MNKLPVEIILKQLLTLSDKDREKLCSVNKEIRTICKTHEDYIYNMLLKKHFKVSKPKEFYKLITIQNNAIDENDVSINTWFKKYWPEYHKKITDKKK